MSSIIKPNRFVGMHAHSGFSTFDGLGYPQEHIDYVLKNNMNAWCLTDHGHMNGFAHAYLHTEKLKKSGINFKFIPGCEMYLHPDLDQWKQDYLLAKEANNGNKKAQKSILDSQERIVTPIGAIVDKDDDPIKIDIDDASLTVENEDETKTSKFYDPVKRRHHLVVLPKTSIGLQRLFHLVSRGYSEGFYRFPRIDYKMLREAAEGGHLIITSACAGGNLAYEVYQYIQELTFDELTADLLDDPILMDKVMNSIGNEYGKMVDAVGLGNAYLELQFNKLPAQHLLNRALIEFANRNNLHNELIVTCDSHYADPDHWREREIYKKLGWLKNKEELNPDMLPNSRDELKCELYPKNADQVWESFKYTTKEYDFYDDLIVKEAIERTHDIVYDNIGDIQPDTSIKLPSYVVPKDKTEMNALIDLCKEGLIKLGKHNDREYLDRIKYELGVIKDKDFAKYFLTMKKIIDIAAEYMFIGTGRGSAAGSLVAYVLGIHDTNPLEYNLLFERFLSQDMVSYPDIDVDFSDRDALVKHLRKEFGDNNVVPISNVLQLKLKSLIKDISKFYGIEFKEVNNALNSLDNDVKNGKQNDDDASESLEISLEDALKYSKKTANYLTKYPEILEPIEVLFKQNRALGKHAGGVIISENIVERMPLIKSKGEFQTPWVEGMHYKHLESMGWIKFDLLGLETLRLFEKTIELILKKNGVKKPKFKDIKKWYNENLAPDVVDLDDQKVYKNVYHKGKWVAIFQCTQKGSQNLYKRAKPTSIIDLATLSAIYRPGPLGAKVDKRYIDDKKNPDKVEYGHPLIEEVLKETHGSIIFQESVMELCNKVAGFPKDECNAIRKMLKPAASGTENQDKARALRSRFIEGCLNNGVAENIAIDLYEKILYFSKYGFNKCLHGDTLVEITAGKIKIKDVRIGDKILSKNGYVKVKDKMIQGVKPLHKITTKSGKELICTLDHKIQTPVGMKRLEDIIKDKLSILVNSNNKNYSAIIDEIVNVEFVGEDQTYDLEIDHPDHTFYANDISVSNSHSCSYSIISYQCAWLLTYYEEEWVTAYLESTAGTKKAPKALSEAKSLGYKIAPLDINLASTSWTAVGPKTLMPSFKSCKGLGTAAIKEIIKNRPYKSIDDFLWDESGNWRHSKFNLTALKSLIKIRAFDSMELVGKDRLFTSYRQMYDVLINHNKQIKKSLKKNPFKGRDNFYEIIENSQIQTEWQFTEKVAFDIECLDTVDINRLLPEEIFKAFSDIDVKSLDDYSKKGDYWFVVLEVLDKKTKTGKPYWIIKCISRDSEIHRMFCWDSSYKPKPEIYSLAVSTISSGNYGFSTSANDLRILNI